MKPYDQDFTPKPRRSAWWGFIGYWASVLVMIGALIAILYLVSSCSTVTPKAVESTQASYDGDSQNSGILGFMANGDVHISENARNRYNSLVEVYGRDFDPPLRRDSGVTELPDHTFAIDRQHVVDFQLMAEKKRSGIKPHQ